ncbi:hypothetical protein D6853_09905 [Butyrivibrio sp. X503]|uniref:hypothetical protein n=1 Tax=Butyrivibrio sp. X503 TaxID=2364878 RepID=UPI000EA8B719|nr:hypothetical protein [Butyrivibrio sp. X503]RKM55851.1 hypothetical protein D6853_09905 [Butyrivibrio sp. X503]
MKKRLLAMAIVAIMVTGCGENANTDNVNEQASATEQSSIEAAAAEQTSEDAAAIEQTSEDASATEQTSEDAAATAQTSEVASATEQASKETAATEQASKEAAAEQPAQDNAKEESKQATANLKDGTYTTNLVSEPFPYSPGYVKSVSVTDNAVIIEGDVYQYDDNWNTIDLGTNTYTLPIDANTQYLSSGGEEAAKHMSKEDFASKFPQIIGSGLGLGIKIENGVVVSFDIFS